MTRRPHVLAAALTIGIVGALTGCGSGSASAGQSAGGDATGKKIRIGTTFDKPGLGLKQGTTMSGFDVDVATYVAKKLGSNPADIEWVQTLSAQRETLIATGQVDLIVATYSITDKRKDHVSFAGPYFVAGQSLLVRSDDAAITGLGALDGKKLCTVKGSTSAQLVKEKVPGVNLQESAAAVDCVTSLVAKKVDAVTTDDAILAGFAAQAPFKGRVKLVGPAFSTESYGIGLKKGDTDLCTQVTAALTAMIADGTWQKAVAKNFGPAGYQPGAGNPPTPAACS